MSRTPFLYSPILNERKGERKKERRVSSPKISLKKQTETSKVGGNTSLGVKSVAVLTDSGRFSFDREEKEKKERKREKTLEQNPIAPFVWMDKQSSSLKHCSAMQYSPHPFLPSQAHAQHQTKNAVLLKQQAPAPHIPRTPLSSFPNAFLISARILFPRAACCAIPCPRNCSADATCRTDAASASPRSAARSDRW